MGNHERKHIRSALGETRAALSQNIVKAQLGEEYDEWLAYIETFSRHIELPEAILVHGMFEPGIALEDQRDTVVIGTLSGEKYMNDHYPEPWYVNYAGPKPLIVGHHDYLGQGDQPLIHNDLVYGIDTGAAHGGRLTALILPEFQMVSVPSREDHWAAQRWAYAVLAGSDRSNLDLDWETLEAFSKSAGANGLPTEKQDRAERCAAIATECQRMMSEVVRAANTLCQEIIDDLQRTDGWNDLSQSKQAARYAERVGAHPAARLLYAARRDGLNDSAVLRRARTPRELLRLAESLDIECRIRDQVEAER